MDMVTQEPALFKTTLGPVPAPEVNIAGIWASSAVLCSFVACIVLFGIYRTYLGKTAEPESKHVEKDPEEDAAQLTAPSNDAGTNTVVTVSGGVPQTYEQEVELEEK